MDLIFNMQNPQLLNWSLLVEEIFQVHGQNLWQIFHLSIFVISRTAITKATEYVTFGFSFHILVCFPTRKVRTSFSESDTDFSV